MKPDEISVLHIATALSWRGGEQQVAYLVSELAAKQVRQVVLCSAGSAMESWCKKSSVTHFTAKKHSSLDISYARKIRQLCNDHKIALVHTHDSHAHTFAVMAAMLGNEAKIIVSRRVDFPVSSGPFSRYKYNHSRIARILCVSDKIRLLTLPAVKDPLKVITVHSGIDFSRFRGKTATGILHREFQLPDNAVIIGNVAALAPHKDYATFVKTAVLLHPRLPDAFYFIIGEGDERRAIESLIAEHNMSGRIIMTGFRDDIPDILPELDVMLVTSETEGLGTSILDAFACSVPVVATVAGGIPEIVKHEQTGLLAVVGDTPGLAEQVMRLLHDASLRSSVVAGAHHHLQEFTRGATASKTLTEYLAVTGSSL